MSFICISLLIMPTLPKMSFLLKTHLAHFYLEIQAMDSVDNSSGAVRGAPPAAAHGTRLFPESNLGKPLMKRFLAELAAANVDEESFFISSSASVFLI